MKILAAILAVSCLLALAGCAKKKLAAASGQTEILAVFSARDKLFLIDSEHEYEFSSAALEKFYFLKDFIEKNERFIKRGEALIGLDLQLGGKTNIFFNLVLDAASGVAADRHYKLEPQKNGDILVAFSDRSGKLVKLKEREELLAKFAMQGSLPAQKIVISSKTDVAGAVSTALSEAAAPIIFPFWVLSGVLKNK